LSRLRLPLALLTLALLGLAAHAEPEEATPVIDPSIGRVDVTLELPKDVPYVGEMIILRMRTTIRGDVALDDIRQPPFTNFNWQQLGRDKPIRVMANGFNVPGYERDIAIFPQQAGRLIIEPFVRHVTMIVGANQRVQADFTSKPVFVDVQRYEGINKGADWWLPAKGVTIKETWSPRPDEIEPGKVGRRVVTLEAIGTTADRLPPPPVMHVPGVITFTGPATRETILTADGPIARATYQWDVRPVSNSPAKMPAIRVPWFDITERRMRDVAIGEQWVSYIGAEGAHRHVDRSLGARLFTSGPLMAGLASLVWALGVAGLLIPKGPAQWIFARPQALRTLARRARAHDALGVKAALMDLARSDAPRWRHIESDPDLATRLADLDRSLFAVEGAKPPMLKPLATDIIRRWRTGETEPRAAKDDALVELDGVAPRRRGDRVTQTRS
jgi:hypothetical protein